ncbi:type III PLP-dependent enzyme [Actibacterium lipolyticum]|uniref:ornithine decarboxylase n=1 Tax=Actibacterium lipolyticum TaxID=1524263 RepID=A0A238JQM6_9RHOB|nr:type III PLP-dependent enzyme [Actibacterium lipolyticum]SMX32988.1 Lysine/ornithine decarboxylase [Actibacterium lipolyticum]
MGLQQEFWETPSAHIRATRPDHPVIYAAPEMLQASARRFIDGFPGLVSYAVKANPDPVVLANLAAAGVVTFDVASPQEMAMVQSAVPGAVMHYNNPVRSVDEIAQSVAFGVTSYSIDSLSELAKLAPSVSRRCEVAVRFKLPVAGAVYDFGDKFGATADQAVVLLQEVAALGFTPAMTFHPGTQCTDPAAWRAYILAAADIAKAAGVKPARLNVGGGFPSHRQSGNAPQLDVIFSAIKAAGVQGFGPDHPVLLCEPGRAMVAEGFTLATRVKAIRDGAHVFLNDGIYGGLAEAPLMGTIDRTTVIRPDGMPRTGPVLNRVVFGPTCDSLDRLPGTLRLPSDMVEGDYVLFHGVGAYSTATVTRFNGYGALEQAVVFALSV